MSKRQRAFEYYLHSGRLEKSAASATQLDFKGPATAFGIVARCDLNGYSKWVQEGVGIDDRVALLDDFFSSAVHAASRCKGVYYRDEGDCIVTLFSPYFFESTTYDDVLGYAKAVTSRTYGSAELTCKTVISAGPLTFYQKGPEKLENDWSAEGDPFVTAIRLEAAVDSEQNIYVLKSEFDGGLRNAANAKRVGPGTRYYWRITDEKIQVQGLQASGGWLDLVVHRFVPGGDVD